MKQRKPTRPNMASQKILVKLKSGNIKKFEEEHGAIDGDINPDVNVKPTRKQQKRLTCCRHLGEFCVNGNYFQAKYEYQQLDFNLKSG